MGKIENKNASQRFEQMHSSKIERMFWIAGSIFSDGLKELLNDLLVNDWQDLFPDIISSEKYAEYQVDDDLPQALIDHNKFGFIAEVSIPECHTFKFQAGKSKPISWSVNSDVYRVVYCYAETTEELIDKIEKICEKTFNEDVVRERGRQVKQNIL